MMLCLNREEGEEITFSFSGKKSEDPPGFLWVHREWSDGVASVSSLWNHQMFVTSWGLGFRFLLSGSHSFLSPLKNAPCPRRVTSDECALPTKPRRAALREVSVRATHPQPQDQHGLSGELAPASFSSQCWLTSSRCHRWKGVG